MPTIIIVVAVIVILVLWFISVQRNLVNREEMCKNAMSQIGVQQSSRWDALTALAELVKSYSEHEYGTLKDIIAQRQGINQNSTVADANAQEGLIQEALKKISVVVEQYPDLKASQMYNNAMNSVNTYENNVRLSRMTFNDSVTIFNRVVRQFPSSIVAGMLGFAVKDYLQEVQGKTDMPSMRIQ